MRIISIFFVVAIVIFGMTFATLNSESVTINYYIDQSTLPLSLLLVIVFALGCLLSFIVGLWFILKSKIQIYRMRNKLSLAEKEIENLRAIPLQGNV